MFSRFSPEIVLADFGEAKSALQYRVLAMPSLHLEGCQEGFGSAFRI